MNTLANVGINVIPVVEFDNDSYVDTLTGEIYGHGGTEIPPGIYAIYRNLQHSWDRYSPGNRAMDIDAVTRLITVAPPS